MSFQLRFTPEAANDLKRLYGFLAKNNPKAAKKALKAIDKAWGILEHFPFSCRKADDANPFLREILISLEIQDMSRCMKLKTMRRSPFWLCATKEKRIITNAETL